MGSGMNVLFILSDEHARDAAGCYAHPIVRTPNLDRLAASGTRFDTAYTPCPICIPARAALATGHHVHDIGYWDNGIPYDGAVRSWHHELRDRGRVVDSIGKLHFKGQGCDHGFRQEIEPLHVVDGVGDLLGCIRDDAPRRHKRAGIEEAGPGDSTYIRYDRDNADRACSWLHDHANDASPWVLQVGFVLPHPPYIAPPDLYDDYPLDAIALPPQWSEDRWPRHPTLEHFRSFFDFDRPFGEQTVRRLAAAYYGAVSYLDRQIGRVLDALTELGLAQNTLVIYASDHGESMGARGIFGKFTMYDESAAVPLIVAGPGVDAGAVCVAPVSLVDVYPTVLEAAGLPDATVAGLMADRPGRSLLAAARSPGRERAVLSEYHAVGSRRGYYMLRYRAWKYVHYVDEPAQLFDLDVDPSEINDLAIEHPAADSVQQRMRAMLFDILDPDAADRQARDDQKRTIERHGGREAVIGRGAFDNSPVPGEEPKFHL
ncbi:MAG: sulfatase [Spirochaetaceae bacterium]|nr:MAG: sulfatase [Spirochaetaceae bacterium]